MDEIIETELTFRQLLKEIRKNQGPAGLYRVTDDSRVLCVSLFYDDEAIYDNEGPLLSYRWQRKNKTEPKKWVNLMRLDELNNNTYVQKRFLRNKEIRDEVGEYDYMCKIASTAPMERVEFLLESNLNLSVLEDYLEDLNDPILENWVRINKVRDLIKERKEGKNEEE